MSIEVGMIVQIRLSKSWGSDPEIAARNRLCDAIEEGFRDRGLGFLDGTDVGGGCTNLFICEIPPHRWDEALALVVCELTERGMMEGVRIARTVTDWPEGEDVDEPPYEREVVWPQGASQEWSLFYWMD